LCKLDAAKFIIELDDLVKKVISNLRKDGRDVIMKLRE